MSIFKGIILILAIAAISCENSKLFDLDEMLTQGTLLNFLNESKMFLSGVPVTTDSCLDNPAFKSTKITIDPPELVKGQSIRIKVVGALLNDQTISKLHLETFYNGGSIYKDDVDKGNTLVKKGMYGYDYEASVPTFTPSGKWEIHVYLVNDKGENLSCLKCMFTMP